MKKAKKLICLMLTLVMLMGMVTAIPVSAVTESGIDLSDFCVIDDMSWKATAEDNCTDNAAVPHGSSWLTSTTEIVTETIDGNTDKAFMGTRTNAKWQMGPIAKNPADTTNWTGFTDDYTSDKIVEISMDMALSQLGYEFKDVFLVKAHKDSQSFGGFNIGADGSINYRNKSYIATDTGFDMKINEYVNLKMIIDCENYKAYYYIDNAFAASETYSTSVGTAINTFQTVADVRTSGETTYIYMDNVALTIYAGINLNNKHLIENMSWRATAEDNCADNTAIFGDFDIEDDGSGSNKVFKATRTASEWGLWNHFALADASKGIFDPSYTADKIIEMSMDIKLSDVSGDFTDILRIRHDGTLNNGVAGSFRIQNGHIMTYKPALNTNYYGDYTEQIKSLPINLKVIADCTTDTLYYYMDNDYLGKEVCEGMGGVKGFAFKAPKLESGTGYVYFDDVTLNMYSNSSLPETITFEALTGASTITEFSEIGTDLKIKGTVPASLMDSEGCTVYAGLFKDRQLCAVATNNVSKSDVSYELNFDTLEDAQGVKSGNYELKIFVFDTALKPILLSPKADLLAK